MSGCKPEVAVFNPSMTTEKYPVQTIRDYLLGRLPEEETERLDELSIADDECSERIRAVEHDLVDAFARAELLGADLEQFRTKYLTTAQGHEAIRFAQALQSLDAGSPESGRGATPEGRETRRWRELVALAAAVVLLATAGLWLALDNRTLRVRVTSAESARDELQRDRQLREAEARRTADAIPPSTSSGASPLTASTLVLNPQMRSAGQLPTIALSDGSGDLAVRLNLEPVDYPAYEASLIPSKGGPDVWRADRLTARTVDGRKAIDLHLPATVLNPQEYLIRVSGVSAGSASEVVGEYRFTVVK